MDGSVGNDRMGGGGLGGLETSLFGDVPSAVGDDCIGLVFLSFEHSCQASFDGMIAYNIIHH